MLRKTLLLLLCTLLGTQTIHAQPIANHVILIGLDGWASHDLDKAHDIPNLMSLMEGGACSMHKRSVIPSSSAINWASMFMGVGPEMHGYTTWGSKTPEVASITTNGNNIFPTIFSVIREHYPEAETGCTFEWDGIKYVIDTLSISYVEYFNEGWKHLEENCDKIVQYIQNKKPVFFAPCFDGIDGIGHEKGWYTEDYYDYLVRIDCCVGRIIQALKDAGIYDDTVIIVTGDHGGHDQGHGTLDLRDMESPLVIYGKKTRTHHQLDEPIVQYDIAATIAYILGVDIPEAWRGKPVKQAFE